MAGTVFMTATEKDHGQAVRGLSINKFLSINNCHKNSVFTLAYWILILVLGILHDLIIRH